MTKPETKFKQFVRKKLGVKRITLQAQQRVWATLPQANKNKYGGWKPTGVVPKKAPMKKGFIMPPNLPPELRKKIVNILTKEGPPSGVNAQAHLMKRIQKIINNEQEATKAPIITLVPTNVCVLGQGVHGKVCVRKTPAGVKYAVKTTVEKSGHAFSDLMKEKATHMKFYYGLPDSLKKYFPRPVTVRGEPDVYAMTMFDGIPLYEALSSHRSSEYKRMVINQLRKAVFAMWTSGYIHGDLHMNNIMVSRGDKPGIIKILDFGFMRKSNINIPNKTFKINGTVGYNNLNDKWEKWFKDSWRKHLRSLGLSSSNPNMIVFPQRMGLMGYFAKHHKPKFENLNKHGNQPKKAPVPKKPPALRGLGAQRLKKYKQLVRNRMGVKRVTVQAQIVLWKKLTNKNKEQFGTWKPDGVVKHRTSPPKPKAPTAKPTMNQYMMKAFMAAPPRADTMLRFWMTHYTTEQKKEIYKKISDPEQAKKDFPLCK